MSTRAKYTRLPAKSDVAETKADTDIILKRSPGYGKYIGRALTLFFDEKKDFVTLRAADRVIERAIWVAEVLKRKVGGLHQVTRITEQKIVDVYTPT
jgi:DNA-binding protein